MLCCCIDYGEIGMTKSLYYSIERQTKNNTREKGLKILKISWEIYNNYVKGSLGFFRKPLMSLLLWNILFTLLSKYTCMFFWIHHPEVSVFNAYF